MMRRQLLNSSLNLMLGQDKKRLFLPLNQPSRPKMSILCGVSLTKGSNFTSTKLVLLLIFKTSLQKVLSFHICLLKDGIFDRYYIILWKTMTMLNFRVFNDNSANCDFKWKITETAGGENDKKN
eukprot:TRINITY_DN52439_c0_g1_i1.p3 TRINITY_DN52439_c0_g1~~TRINITY_DN52439_c0_g1_i1.p3  ORF type:complete len:124 (+),score=22.06 TRINITY_DN52439_c0_g1_i1:1146-1517(+)